MSESDHDRWFENELIRRAEEGDPEAGRIALETIAGRIETRRYESPLFDYLATNIRAFLDDGIPLVRALGVEEEPNKGGRPRKYDKDELAAVDLILRDHANFGPEEAITWINANIHADRKLVRQLRREYDARYNKFAERLAESLDLDVLLHMSGSMREKVAEVMPHT